MSPPSGLGSEGGSLSMMIATGVATVLLTVALAMIRSRSSSSCSTVSSSSTNDKKSKVEQDAATYPGGSITLYYGTQTGTAEAYARTIEREGPEHGFHVQVVDVETIEDIQEALLEKDRLHDATGRARTVFLCSTYGEGEPPDNAVNFTNDLKAKAGCEVLFKLEESIESDPVDPKLLEDVDYLVFGLGNRQYDHFNAMAIFIDHALARIGANRIADAQLGDDEDDMDEDFENWKNNVMWPTLEKKYLSANQVQSNLAHRRNNDATAQVPPQPAALYTVHYHKNLNPRQVKPNYQLSMDQVHSSSKPYFTAVDCPVKVLKELCTTATSGSTVHMEVDISKAGFTYQTADNLGVLPMNAPQYVESVAKSLQLDLDAVFSISAAPGQEWHGATFPMPLTVRECLTRYCDVTAAPRRSQLKVLASYATDPLDQKVLLRMASKDGKEEYHEKILDRYVGLADLLKLCPSISMPWEHFLSLCPSLQPRFFTISSSSSVHPKSVHITVGVTQDARPDGTFFKGVCSNHLAERKVNVETIRVYNRPSSFRLPTDPSLPIIMIGPGTGIAPMRALLQEREYQRTVLKKKVGRNILYFGCKKQSEDYIYKDELMQFQKNGTLQDLRVAFSRDQAQKVYVQDLLQQHAAETWKLINEQGAHVYVCGAVKMGHDVAETLKTLAVTVGKLPEATAKIYFNKLSHNGRFVQELWES